MTGGQPLHLAARVIWLPAGARRSTRRPPRSAEEKIVAEELDRTWAGSTFGQRGPSSQPSPVELLVLDSTTRRERPAPSLPRRPPHPHLPVRCARSGQRAVRASCCVVLP